MATAWEAAAKAVPVRGLHGHRERTLWHALRDTHTRLKHKYKAHRKHHTPSSTSSSDGTHGGVAYAVQQISVQPKPRAAAMGNRADARDRLRSTNDMMKAGTGGMSAPQQARRRTHMQAEHVHSPPRLLTAPTGVHTRPQAHLPPHTPTRTYTHMHTHPHAHTQSMHSLRTRAA